MELSLNRPIERVILHVRSAGENWIYMRQKYVLNSAYTSH
jgi:hypothetical protein